MDVKHRMRRVVAVLIALLVVSAGAARADVKTNEKTHVEFGGTLGRMVKMFGGKAAREGVETSVAVKGDRQMSTTGDTAHLIDLAEEKIYDLDLRHRTYRVTTFAELRRQMEEDRKRAEENASKDRASSSREPRKEYEADFDAKDTGQRKTINGFACREVIATVTVREKGKTLEEGGGIVLTDDLWLTPGVAAMQEVAAFNIRYFKQIAGPYAAGVPAGQMAMAAGMFPGLAEAFAELNSEHVNVDGTPIVSDIKVEGVKSREELAREKQSASEDDQSSGGGGLGGLFGGLAKKLAEKKAAGGDQQADSPRTTVMTVHNEVLTIGTSVAPEDVAVPAGFREKH